MHEQLRADRIYLGWQYALLQSDPGPPPKRPTPPEAEVTVDPDWVRAQQREENVRNLPVKIFCYLMFALSLLFLALMLFAGLSWAFGVVGMLATLVVGGIMGLALRQGEQAIEERVAEEKARLERRREHREQRLNDAHEDHAEAYKAWEARKAAYEEQRDWFAVAVPDEVDRLDVAGGTLEGWSALITLLGATRLYSGGHLTVLDLSEGAVARDLIEVARRGGDDPLVWVLPVDLPRLDLGAHLAREQFSDVLAHVVSVSEETDTSRDISFDNAILERILEVLGDGATIASVTAALRALAQVGDPRDDVRQGILTSTQLERIGALFGRGATDRFVIERAWALESQLRKLEALGRDAVRLPPARLRVVSMDRKAGMFSNRVLGTYVATALTHVLRQAPPGRPWNNTIIVAGAEKLRGDVLDRLMDACETSRTGLVLTYRSFSPQVKERVGRGHAAVAFMRLGNADDARIASEHIGQVGPESQRLMMAWLTEQLSATLAKGPPGEGGRGSGYTSTISAVLKNPGADAGDGWSPHDEDTDEPETSRSGLSDDISASTAWAASTSKIVEGIEQLSKISREFLVEPHELQQLPSTALVVTHATPSGRRVVLADANPAILALPRTTLAEIEDERAAVPIAPSVPPAFEPPRRRHARGEPPRVVPASHPASPPRDGPRHAGGNGSSAEAARADDDESDPRPPPNLGPPPERLDWRKPRKP